ncbi:hypothetical protein QMZ05_11215 [Bradyrhizobium sp. INPA03-11B]|uniref:beta-mannosidase n=1 Tax=Bradyrhizobium sp. INPA03-11B TaxID=418598 RepID=UPI00338EAB2D
MSFSNWMVAHFEPGTGEQAGAGAEGRPNGDWLPVTLPGDIHQSLFEAGLLCDPHGEGGEEGCRWISDKEWWWRHVFDAPEAAPGERLILVLHGLDTFATVWLNGVEVTTSDNMFLGVEIDVTRSVRPGNNLLAIRFDPVASRLDGCEAPTWPGVGGQTAQTKRNLVRKAQFGWGWDWGPVQPTIGVWRPVELKRQRSAAIDTLQFRTLSIAADRSAAVTIELEVDAFAPPAALTARIEIVDPDGAPLIAQEVELNGEDRHRGATLAASIANARLWWTKDLGDQPLYRATAILRSGSQEIDRRDVRVGIRTIALDTSPDPDEPGTDFFRFVLNGRPIFAKGACWIPAHSLVGLLTEAQYRPLIEAARDGGMNMLRVWGGGIYEHDAFYDLCDECGVLVWQDFMFACAPYPDKDPAMIASVRAEAAYQVRRLRHHPSLALWCGNNENQFIQDFVNEAVGRRLPLEGAHFYDDVIPEQVVALDPMTPYWPGSPFGGPHANSMRGGDLHNWTVWHGLPPVPDDRSIGSVDRSPAGVDYHRYAEDMGRFISEFGIQASPVMETLRRSVPADQLTLKSPAMENRIKDNPRNKVDGIMEPVTGLPTTIEQYVDFTQITQAEGLKFGIEHFRRRKPHCSGTLIWQLNDCWPGVSWSVIDFHGFQKAGYHYVRRAYAPVLASFKLLGDGAVELWITNDRAQAVAGNLTIELVDLLDGSMWRETIAYDVADNFSAAIWRADPGKLGAAPRRALTVRTANDVFPANRHFFAAIRDLPRPVSTAPKVRIEKTGMGELSVDLSASAYLFFVHMLVASPTAWFSDNYFDMMAGESRRITIGDPGHDLQLDDLVVRSR